MLRPRFPRAACSLAFAAAISLAGPVAAQTNSGGSLIWKRIRAQVDTTRLEGTVLAQTDSSLTVQLVGAERTIRLAAIDALWVQRRDTGQGALIGGLGIFGAWVLVVGGFAIAGERPEYQSVGPIALASAAGGALIGAMIGSFSRQWQPHPLRRLAPDGHPLNRTMPARGFSLGWSISF